MSKKTPSWLKALGKRALPAELEVRSETFRLAKVFKDDFFAVTACYERDVEKVLLKVGRQASMFLIPMGWIGRFLAARERTCLQRLEHLTGVPHYIEPWESTGFVREFVPGHAMAKGEQVPDQFHDRLKELVLDIHSAGMAYVDLEKCENVLVGEDGMPYLFDFQISWHWSKRWGGELFPMRWLRRRFQKADLYHLMKLKRRTRRDLMTADELAISYRKPWYVHAHRFVFRPLTLARRAILSVLDPRRKDGERGRVNP